MNMRDVGYMWRRILKMKVCTVDEGTVDMQVIGQRKRGHGKEKTISIDSKYRGVTVKD